MQFFLYIYSMLSTDLSTNCATNFIQTTIILITLGDTSAENKGLESAQSLIQ